MTIQDPAPAKSELFNENYDRVGHYITDGDLLPYYLPKSATHMVLPGGPILIQWAGAQRVFLSQGPIRAGKWGSFVRPGRWVAQLPANLSANVVVGDKVFWDIDNNQVRAAALDLTNGYELGFATWSTDPNFQNNMFGAGNDHVPVDGNGRVICGDTNSNVIVVASEDVDAAITGTVTVY